MRTAIRFGPLAAIFAVLLNSAGFAERAEKSVLNDLCGWR